MSLYDGDAERRVLGSGRVRVALEEHAADLFVAVRGRLHERHEAGLGAVLAVRLALEQQRHHVGTVLEAGERERRVAVGLDLRVRSAPASSSRRTPYVWPFMAASVSGEMPRFELMRELISAPFANSSRMTFV